MIPDLSQEHQEFTGEILDSNSWKRVRRSELVWNGLDRIGTARTLKPRDKKCSQDASLCEQEKQ